MHQRKQRTQRRTPRPQHASRRTPRRTPRRTRPVQLHGGISKTSAELGAALGVGALVGYGIQSYNQNKRVSKPSERNAVINYQNFSRKINGQYSHKEMITKAYNDNKEHNQQENIEHTKCVILVLHVPTDPIIKTGGRTRDPINCSHTSKTIIEALESREYNDTLYKQIEDSRNVSPPSEYTSTDNKTVYILSNFTTHNIGRQDQWVEVCELIAKNNGVDFVLFIPSTPNVRQYDILIVNFIKNVLQLVPFFVVTMDTTGTSNDFINNIAFQKNKKQISTLAKTDITEKISSTRTFAWSSRSTRFYFPTFLNNVEYFIDYTLQSCGVI